MLEHLPTAKTLSLKNYHIAVLLPCHNEALTIAQVVTEFQSTLPEAKIYVYDNHSTVLGTALLLFKEVRPFLFFGIIFVGLALISLILGIPIVKTFLETGLVPRFPTAILAASIMLLAFLSLTCGLILDSVARGRREAKRIAYLAHPLPEFD